MTCRAFKHLFPPTYGAPGALDNSGDRAGSAEPGRGMTHVKGWRGRFDCARDAATSGLHWGPRLRVGDARGRLSDGRGVRGRPGREAARVGTQLSAKGSSPSPGPHWPPPCAAPKAPAPQLSHLRAFLQAVPSAGNISSPQATPRPPGGLPHLSSRPWAELLLCRPVSPERHRPVYSIALGGPQPLLPPRGLRCGAGCGNRRQITWNISWSSADEGGRISPHRLGAHPLSEHSFSGTCPASLPGLVPKAAFSSSGDRRSWFHPRRNGCWISSNACSAPVGHSCGERGFSTIQQLRLKEVKSLAQGHTVAGDRVGHALCPCPQVLSALNACDLAAPGTSRTPGPLPGLTQPLPLGHTASVAPTSHSRSGGAESAQQPPVFLL
ncbi:uncharacterized protein LOC128626894 isoform X2 [Artibeus jamaicensis]|nr:uncharacterized protein LOC128626894 isoform X2 [Artibeus jamaicensis]XP_053518108.1 uncharacterized protein LOC128626894 isoform X2 [Artibeus jamaicensis]XP_053518109.1 uncharacterized protein LOC128626894 isoform X2 [Artibeus jamaicensis]